MGLVRRGINLPTQTMVSGILPTHVEGLTVGDVDDDGQNEIVASMATSGGPTQIRLFRKVGTEWIPENATPLLPGRMAERCP